MFRSILGNLLGKVAGLWLGNKLTVILCAVVALVVGLGIWGVKHTYSQLQVERKNNGILADRNANLKVSNQLLVERNNKTVQRWKESQHQEYLARLEVEKRARQRLTLIRKLQVETDYLKTIKRPEHEQNCHMHPAVVTVFNMLYPTKIIASGSTASGGKEGGGSVAPSR